MMRPARRLVTSALRFGRHHAANPEFGGRTLAARPRDARASGAVRAARVAVVLVVNIETYDVRGRGPAVQPHLMKPANEVANRGWQQYGNVRGLARLARVFAAHDASWTACVNSGMLAEHAGVAAELGALARAGTVDIVGHGKSNTDTLAGLEPVAERAYVADCLDMTERAVGVRPRGWLSPGFDANPSTAATLAHAGLEFSLDYTDDDVAYWHVIDDKPCLALPYSMETNDISLVLCRNFDARQYEDQLFAHISQLVDEAQADAAASVAPGCAPYDAVVCFGIHTFIIGQPAYARALGSLLQRIQALGPLVEISTATHVAERIVDASAFS